MACWPPLVGPLAALFIYYFAALAGLVWLAGHLEMDQLPCFYFSTFAGLIRLAGHLEMDHLPHFLSVEDEVIPVIAGYRITLT